MLGFSWLAFGIQEFVYLKSTGYQTLNTTYQIHSQKVVFLTFYEVTNFILYKDFRLCYLIQFLKMKKMGNS